MTQAFNLALLANNVNTSGQLNASTGLFNAAPVANGGTGLATITANNLMVGNGTGAVALIAPGSNGNQLISNGTSWASSAAPYAGSKGQIFTSSGTFTVPAAVTAVKVTVIGGGGGGAGDGAAGTGGTSSFGAYCSATGGTASIGGGSNTGGTGSGGDLNQIGGTGQPFASGAAGVSSVPFRFSDFTNNQIGVPGTGAFGSGGGYTGNGLQTPTGYGSGGYGTFTGGGGGGIAIKYATGLTPGGTVSVTVGSGGTAGSGGSAGTAGIVVVEW